MRTNENGEEICVHGREVWDCDFCQGIADDDACQRVVSAMEDYEITNTVLDMEQDTRRVIWHLAARLIFGR